MESDEKIIIPNELQKEMLEFFLTTSIPRIKKKRELEREKNKSHIENKKR